MSGSRIGIATVALAVFICLGSWSVARRRHGSRLAPGSSAVRIPATQWSSRQFHWDLGTVADAAARSRVNNWLDGLSDSERGRVLSELERFRIVAHDRLKPATRPGHEFFQDNEVPAIWVFRNDTPTAGPAAPPEDLHFDNIWQKRVFVDFEWELQDGQGIDLGIFGVKGYRMGWETSFVLPLPHPDRPVQTQPPTIPQP